MFETKLSQGIPLTTLLLKIMCRSESAVITNPNIPKKKDENTNIKAKDKNKNIQEKE